MAQSKDERKLMKAEKLRKDRPAHGEVKHDQRPLDVNLGEHKLRIPQGAAPAGTRFAVTELANKDIIVVRIQANDQDEFKFPEGNPAQLTLSYRERRAKEDSTIDLQIYQVDENDKIVEDDLPSVGDGHDSSQKRLTVSLAQLSRYAIGGGRAE